MKKHLFALSLVVSVAAAVFIGVQVEKRYKASQYEETAVPYVKKVVPEISKWDLEIIKEYMPPEALEGTSEERMVRILAYLSRLGELKRMEEPVYSSVIERPVPEGEKKVITYTVDVEYENGEGVMTIGLLDKDGSYSVHNFHINSEALAE